LCLRTIANNGKVRAGALMRVPRTDCHRIALSVQFNSTKTTTPNVFDLRGMTVESG